MGTHRDNSWWMQAQRSHAPTGYYTWSAAVVRPSRPPIRTLTLARCCLADCRSHPQTRNIHLSARRIRLVKAAGRMAKAFLVQTSGKGRLFYLLNHIGTRARARRLSAPAQRASRRAVDRAEGGGRPRPQSRSRMPGAARAAHSHRARALPQYPTRHKAQLTATGRQLHRGICWSRTTRAAMSKAAPRKSNGCGRVDIDETSAVDMCRNTATISA